MGTLAAPPAATGQLRREFGRVRRRARAALLAGAVVAAAAADVWYEILAFWVQRLLRFGMYFPLFFLVAFALFAALVLRRTRTLPLSASLDGACALKERLSAAVRYERLPGVDPEIREAQARETLRSVDFGILRARFRFRPYAALACLAAGVVGIFWLMQRYPEAFRPRNLPFRQGRVIFAVVKDLGGAAGRLGSPEAPPGAGQADVAQGDSPTVIPIPEQGARVPAAPPAAPADQPGAEVPGGEGAADKEPPAAPPPEEQQPERPPRDTEFRGATQTSRLGPDEGGSLGRGASMEETTQLSPPTARPEFGLAERVPDLRGPGGDAPLPPLPFFRLLGGSPDPGALFDPETLNIVLEAYPPKYRAHLESYLKALQALGEKRAGS